MSQYDKTTEAKAEEEFASSIPKQLPDGTVIMPSTRLEADLDKITVRVAHDKSLYLVYHGKVPPLDGQEYISIHDFNREREQSRRFAELLAGAQKMIEHPFDTSALQKLFLCTRIDEALAAIRERGDYP